MPDFVYPSNADLQQIAQDKIPVLTQDDPLFSVLPMNSVDSAILSWEQKDNYLGLQQLRGMDGAPSNVKRVGGKRFIAQPGVYGEFLPIDEQELTQRRQFGTFGTAVDISDLVMDAQDQLLQRRLDRIRHIGWALLASGTFSVSGPTGVTHTDSYSVQTFNAVTDSAAWSDAANAKPLQAFRGVQLKSRGHSVSFGPEARAYMNRVTFNELVANTNGSDLYGKRTTGLANVMSLAEINMVLAGEGLPTIAIYDGGYLDDNGTFQPFIADDKVVVCGARPGGQAIGDYAFTRNANNPDLGPGPYMKVFDNGEREVPRKIEVHDGHNGGPRLFFPSAVVVMSV